MNPIIFLGDSITEAADVHGWFPDLPVRNHGIGGETSAEVLRRVPPLAADRPAAVFLLVGTNDLRDGLPADHTVATIGKILAGFGPGPALHVQSILPRERENAGWVRAVNAELVSLAARHRATYLDLWPAFAGPDGELRPELTYDRLHLTGAGYAVWADLLRPLVAAVGPA